MSKTEILAQLPNLNPDELAEIQAKLDELTGDLWLDPHSELSDTDKSALNIALTDYQKTPNAGTPWPDVKARIQAQLKK